MFEVKMKNDFGWSDGSVETLREAVAWFEFLTPDMEWNEIEGGFVAYQQVSDPGSEQGPFTFIYQIEGEFTLPQWIAAIEGGDDEEL